MPTPTYDSELKKMVPFLGPVGFLLSRKWGARLFHAGTSTAKGKNIRGLHSETKMIPSNHGGPDIRLRIHRPAESKDPLPIMIYYHGGGYMVGCPEVSNGVIERFIKTRPCVVVATDYRKALDHPFPAGFNDCYDTLLWAQEHSEEIGGDRNKLMISGHSAGGGMTAAVTLKARDTGDARIAFQMPIYPMIDDTQSTTSAQLDNVPVWNSHTNKLGWACYLADIKRSGQEVPAYAAPARNRDYTNFPPTITLVGDQEPFLDETKEYVDRLEQAGIPVEFELFKGAFHGFDLLAQKTTIGKAALDFTFDSYAAYYDKYCTG